MKYNIIGLLGLNGSGKDFKVKQLESELEECQKFDFSDGVRDYTFSFLTGKPITQIAYDEFKVNYSQINLGGGRIHHVQGRQFLDSVGKKMREFDKNFWVNYTVNNALNIFKSSNYTNFIFGSCRYMNEAKGIIRFYNEVSKESTDQYKLKFIFCDFRSEKYDDTRREYQELALFLRDEMDCFDGQDVTELILKITG